MTRNRQPEVERIAALRDAFAPRGAKCVISVPEVNSFELISHSHNILRLDRQRSKDETASTPDNRARLQKKNSGAAETGKAKASVTKVIRRVQPDGANAPSEKERHSPGHLNCRPCLAAREQQMQSSVIDPKLDFATAAPKWLDWHRPHIADRTAWDYDHYIETLKLFGIGPTPLNKIHPGHFEQYQVWRRTKPKRGAKNPRINQELNCLKQILEQAGLWQKLKPFYKQLPMPKWKPPRVMTPEKEDEVLAIAASNKNWEVAHCCLVITDNTGLGPGELRAIQVEHLRLEEKKVYAAAGDAGDKNEFRIAPVALNEPALAAFEILFERYKRICLKQGIAEDVKHFLIPKRPRKGNYLPTQKASPGFIRSALIEIRAAAGMPRLRHYDFRHQCLTTLLEIPEVSIETVQAVARHKIGDRTIEHYSAIRQEKKQVAVDILHNSRRFAALRRPPQRENAEAMPVAASGSFAGNKSYPQR